jgi:hypothetical protein
MERQYPAILPTAYLRHAPVQPLAAIFTGKDTAPDPRIYIAAAKYGRPFVHAIEDVLIIGKSFYNDQGHVIQLLFLKRVHIIKYSIQYFAHG